MAAAPLFERMNRLEKNLFPIDMFTIKILARL